MYYCFVFLGSIMKEFVLFFVFLSFVSCDSKNLKISPIEKFCVTNQYCSSEGKNVEECIKEETTFINDLTYNVRDFYIKKINTCSNLASCNDFRKCLEL